MNGPDSPFRGVLYAVWFTCVALVAIALFHWFGRIG